MTGNTDVILLTFIGTVVGLAGATVRGLRAWGGRLPGRRPRPPRQAPLGRRGNWLRSRVWSATLDLDLTTQWRTRTMRVVTGRHVRDVDVG
jgi:hypothetical protein